MRILQTLGIASCLGGPKRYCGYAAELLQEETASAGLNAGYQLQWHMLHPEQFGSTDTRIFQLNQTASEYTRDWTETRRPFLVVGGDHSCALGTWAGVLKGLKQVDDFGLIWLDAHMDAHTYITSPSGNPHGMPVAALLGKADSRLAALYPARVFINPDKLILLGVRSYEAAEFELLSQAKVDIVYSDQTTPEGGFANALLSAVNKLTLSCQSIGISIDMDLIDPGDAPGVETPVAGGIKARQLIEALTLINRHPKICGLEISEFNPENDRHNKTLHIMTDIINAFYGDIRPYKSLGSSGSGKKGISVPS